MIVPITKLSDAESYASHKSDMSVESSADNDKDAKDGNAASAASVGKDVSAESNEYLVMIASPGSDMNAVNHAGIEFGASSGDDKIDRIG